MKILGDHLEAKFKAVCENIVESPPSPQTLFLVQANQADQRPPIWSHIAKRLVESKGESRFVILVSEEKLTELRRSALYSLLKPYCDTLDRVSEDPSPLLAWMTGLQSLPPYNERRLPELLFIAAACKMEGEGLGEEELSDVISSLRLLEFNGQRKCYFTWHALPRFRSLLDIYFDSIGLKPRHHSIAQFDLDFYLGACLSSFQVAGQAYNLAEAAAQLSLSEGEKISRILALQEREKSFPGLSKVLSFLHRLGLIYTLAQEARPTQYMGITGQEFAEEPALRRELLWAGRNMHPLINALIKDDWKDAGRLVQQHILSLSSSKCLDFTATTQHVEGIFREFLSRIKDYDEQDCKSLCLKGVKTAYLVECSAALADSPLPKTMAESFLALWGQCLQKLPSPIPFSDSEWLELWTRLQHLSELNQQYRSAIRGIRTNQVRARITDKIAENKQVSDHIDHFFSFFAAFLREHDFFLDPAVAKQLSPPLAARYLELDTQLQQGVPPFSDDFRSGKDLTSLIPSLPISQFDRVLVLIVDALSYLDWKLSKDEFSELDITVPIEEDYRLSPVPTYTPCALTALITGYHPSATGICDWRLKTSDGRTIELQNTSECEGLRRIPLSLPKRNLLTLIHSQGGTPLTFLQTSLADLVAMPLPSSEHEKAIAQASELIYTARFETKVVAIYIADFDEFGHWHLRLDGWREYYSMQAGRIKNGLLKPILKRAQREAEKTLVVLTADHGKLTRYESRILSTVLPETNSFQACASLLSRYQPRCSPRHILCWLPDADVEGIAQELRSNFAASADISIFAGPTLKRFFPHDSQTAFVNPNLLVFSRFGTRGQSVAHGGASLSEVVVPAIHFVWEGG
jgi:hypothetical protein